MLLRWSERTSVGAGVGLLIFALMGVVSGRVMAASSIAQSFKADDSNIVGGAIVSLKAGNANTVELGTTENIDRLLGVAGEDSLIELSNGVDTVQVVTTGEAAVLVSDINGEIKTGDKVTASPIAGVGMKAPGSVLVLGTAQSDLASVKTEARTIRDRSGHKQVVHIGAIPLQVDKVFYEGPQQEQNAFVPPALQSLADSVAGGRQVSPIRIMLAGFLIIFMFLAVAIMMYSSVRSSIISIGRNPLSEGAVQKSLFQVGLTIFGVMGFTVIVVYLILTT